ncbi:hypothetical protein K2X05_01075 [bacterium]|nr:hypothetical protein [bacterium]
MKPTAIITISLLISGLSGCAHSVMRGSVAMKISSNQAHVCIDKSEVKAGDRVSLFRNICTSKSVESGGSRSCEKHQIGMGTVKENISEHYSLVQFDEGVLFEEGSFVEKM